MFQRLKLLAIVISIIATTESLAENLCSIIGTRTISFKVKSERNITGYRHVTTDVFLREAKGRNLAVSGDIGLDVSQSTCTTTTERRTHLTSTIVVPEKRLPPPGYELVPGVGWYRLHLTPLTWDEARLACEAEAAHLAVINSQEEATALKKISDRYPKVIPDSKWSDEIFIGFCDPVEGQYITIFGETLSEAGYETWHPRQPDNLRTDLEEKQDCGSFIRTSGKLNDSTCKAKLAYFCEFSI
ncbi:hypothetical protein R5R35_009035 [Gryllus longicercus]|uniref:C-type lectin domain-containing protein n=1 Tax=Gryllus longicercus TaxID=2509291 RepID=A0AAN9WIS1_9ORTH